MSNEHLARWTTNPNPRGGRAPGLPGVLEVLLDFFSDRFCAED
ncbi:MAG: hypothetical protein ACRDTR_15570 [Rubrobacter sp.]